MKATDIKNQLDYKWEKRPNTVWINAKDEIFDIFGLYEPRNGTPFRRMPQETATATSEGVAGLNLHTAGGRLAFATDSCYIAIYAKMSAMCRMPHMPRSGSSGFDLYIRDENQNQKYACSFIPDSSAKTEYTCTGDSRTDNGKMREYVLNFPLYDRVDELYIGVSSSAEIQKSSNPYINEKPIIFYGSSITQGACVSRPGLCYENYISRKLHIDYTNLGFSGSARAEDAIVDYMANLPMSVFVSDYDHNAPDEEYLEKTHHKMYEKIREKNPDVPYIMITKPDFDSHPVIDAKRREVIKRSYEKALENGDKNVYFIDGETLFGNEFRDSCLVDGIHPNDIGHMKMGVVIGDVIEKALKNRK